MLPYLYFLAHRMSSYPAASPATYVWQPLSLTLCSSGEDPFPCAIALREFRPHCIQKQNRYKNPDCRHRCSYLPVNRKSQTHNVTERMFASKNSWPLWSQKLHVKLCLKAALLYFTWYLHRPIPNLQKTSSWCWNWKWCSSLKFCLTYLSHHI